MKAGHTLLIGLILLLGIYTVISEPETGNITNINEYQKVEIFEVVNNPETWSEEKVKIKAANQPRTNSITDGTYSIDRRGCEQNFNAELNEATLHEFKGVIGYNSEIDDQPFLSCTEPPKPYHR